MELYIYVMLLLLDPVVKSMNIQVLFHTKIYNKQEVLCLGNK